MSSTLENIFDLIVDGNENYNLAQNIVEIFTKLSKIGFCMKCFTTGDLQLVF